MKTKSFISRNSGWTCKLKDNTKLSMIKNIIDLYTVEWFVGDAYFKDNMGHPYPLADLYQQICYKAMNWYERWKEPNYISYM